MGMDTQTTEIADGIYRFSTFVPDVGPTGFTFNQYLIDDDQPLLFHTGLRAMFPSLAETMARITPLERIRWITFGHVEADECGAMNELLAGAPHAEVAHGALGCLVSLNDMADRPPVPLTDGQVVELGAHRVRHIDTPHVPHGWEARVLYEETTNTLLCGDLFTQLGRGPAITTDDIVGAAAQAEDVFGASCLTPNTGPTIRRLAALAPGTLAVMHGSCFTGDGESALLALADEYDRRLADGSSASTPGPSPS
jgi:flavorubredoxin